MEISPQASQETHVSPTPAYIPETPQAATIPVEPPPENPHAPSRPSFKDKLLHSEILVPESEEDEELVIESGDVTYDLEGAIPAVSFAPHILDFLNKRMRFTVVIKLLGKTIGYRQLRPEIQKIWKPTGSFRLTDLEDGCFLVRFKNEPDFQHALLGGPWIVYGHYLSVQVWTPDF